MLCCTSRRLKSTFGELEKDAKCTLTVHIAPISQAFCYPFNSAGSVSPQRSPYLLFRSKFLRLAHRRGRWEYWTRVSLAWGFNLLLFFVCAILSLTYGVVKFRGAATSFMLLGWAVAAFQMYLVIEPLQVLQLEHVEGGGERWVCIVCSWGSGERHTLAHR
jgi:hypothetical protein